MTIYKFSADHTNPSQNLKFLLGNKGSGLREMSFLGLPVPPGFIISTEICKNYYQNERNLPNNFYDQLKEALNWLEDKSKQSFLHRNEIPSLIAERSGSSVSMPGMMDTVLNLGLNHIKLEQIIKSTGKPLFCLDTYQRFLFSYATNVLHISDILLTEKLNHYHALLQQNHKNQIALLELLIEDYLTIIKNHQLEVPHDKFSQVVSAIKAVLNSWHSSRAITYRKLHNIDENLGTAICVQTMVFGNLNNYSASGVVFTRSPIDGNRNLYGEFILNAQGEDIVSGTKTPSLLHLDKSFSTIMPEAFNELTDICQRLEHHYRDMQDIEFTVEDKKLYILQTRSGKRTGLAAIKIAVDLVQEKVITKSEALTTITPYAIQTLLHPSVDHDKQQYTVLASGLPASPGAVTGKIVLTPKEAKELSNSCKVILVRNETSPEDIEGMYFAEGILTSKGGVTSHAAVVARGLGKPCICGANFIINEAEKTITLNDYTLHEGEIITIDGNTGQIILGNAKLSTQDPSPEFYEILSWTNEFKEISIRANAETVSDALTSLRFGADGIGLCRTEHMFFEAKKIKLVRKMILATKTENRKLVLDQLSNLQKDDFDQLLKTMKGKPTNIRLLDPPLHEFLPKKDDNLEEISEDLGLPNSGLKQRIQELHEINPMLGHRGCRLGITYPEIYEMQIDAIFSSAANLFVSEKINSQLEIMIPFVCDQSELMTLRKLITERVAVIEKQYSHKFNYKIGTMIELPRAALLSDTIAPFVDYFSFGTNDLTQTTYGISRDDSNKFIHSYLNQHIFKHDPFTKFDTEGVGQLIEISIKKARKVKPNISFSICGQHAGDPEILDFCKQLSINYISCSPYQIPIMKLAAAQINIKQNK